MRSLLPLSCVAVGLFSFSCSSDNLSKTPDDQMMMQVMPKLVSISISELSTLMPNNTIELSATGMLDDGTKPDLSTMVVWTSSDLNVASIDGRILTAIAPGTAE